MVDVRFEAGTPCGVDFLQATTCKVLPQNQHISGNSEYESQSNGNESKTTQPVTKITFKTPRKSKQQELEDKITFLEGMINELSQNPERSQFTLSGLPSGVGSANKLANDTQKEVHEQCNKLIDNLQKQLNDLKEDKLKLETALKEKDAIIRDKDSVMLGMWKDFIGIQTFEDFKKARKNRLGFMSNQSSQQLSRYQSPAHSQDSSDTINRKSSVLSMTLTGKTLGKRKYVSEISQTKHNKSHRVLKKRQDNSGWDNMTDTLQENKLSQLEMKELRYRCATCKKLFSCEIGWSKHTKCMINCGRTTCICDVFSYGKYVHSINGSGSSKPYQRRIETKELSKLEALIETTMKKPELVEPEKLKSVLETKRDIQREGSISFINGAKQQLATVEGWLTTLSNQCEKGELKALGVPICDAIVYPRCPLIFGDDTHKHDHELMLFLKSHDISVRTVGSTAKSDPTVAFVYLLDSDNEYTNGLMLKLQKSLDDLASKISAVVPQSDIQKSIIQAQLSNLYIRQTDYTKDYLSFFIVKSLSKNFDTLRQIGERIGIPFSEAHSQLFTSIQFQSFAENAQGKQVRVQRLKVYNKWVNLLLTTSFKAALSMGTSKLFKGSAVFHMNKLQPSFNDGLLRIELSTYYYSVEQWKNEALQTQRWNQTVFRMERALQEVEEQLIYKVSLKVFWDSFWFQVDAVTTIIDFQTDLWTVVYAYSSRSYLFTGHHTDKHAKSGTQLTFLQRFAGAKALVRVSNGQNTKQFLIYRCGRSRQIPIASLNVKQVEENKMPIDTSVWFYHLSDGQLNQTYFTCDNQQEFDQLFGQDSVQGEPGINGFDNQYMRYCDERQLLNERNALQKDNEPTDRVGSASNKKKREVKFIDKDDMKGDYYSKIQKSHSEEAEYVQQWKRKGQHHGKQRWECLQCRHKTVDKDKHKCV